LKNRDDNSTSGNLMNSEKEDMSIQQEPVMVNSVVNITYIT